MESKATLDVYNFESWTAAEYSDNLKRLDAQTHQGMIGKSVYYVKPAYGRHYIHEWNPYTGEFLLEIDGSKFWTNPFRIKLIE